MRYQLLLFLTFVSIHIFSQNIEIKVIDKRTSETLPYASLYIKNSNKGSVTNINGITILELKKNDTLICSYIGYQTAEVIINSQNKIQIRLIDKTNYISEVTVEAKRKKITAKQIIKKTIKNIDINYPSNPIYMDGFYRETIKKKDKYIQLNEAVVKFYYTAYPQKKLDRKLWYFWHNSYYGTTYNFQMEGNLWYFGDSEKLATHFNTKDDQVKIFGSRSSDNIGDSEPVSLGGPLSMTANDKVKYLYDFLDPNNINKYIFKKSGYKEIDNDIYYVLSFYPKKLTKKVIFDSSKKNKQAIFLGKMYIDMKTFAIRNIDYKFSVDIDYGGVYGPRMPKKSEYHLQYRKIKNKWYLYSYRTYEGKGGYFAERHLQISNIDTTNIIKFNETDSLLKHERLATIRYFSNSYNAHFWADYEKLNNYTLPKKIQEDLEIEKPLTKQYSDRYNYNELLKAPKAKNIQDKQVYKFEETTDSYKYLENINDTNTINYLALENEYSNNFFIQNRRKRENIFKLTNKIIAPVIDTNQVIAKIDTSRNIFINNKDGNFFIYKKINDTTNQTIIDFKPYLKLNNFLLNTVSFSADTSAFAFSFSTNGDINHKIHIKNIAEGSVSDSILNVYEFLWYDNKTIIYTKNDSSLRGNMVFLHKINSDKPDSLIYEEKDNTFDISLKYSGNKNRIFLICESLNENELNYIEPNSETIEIKCLKKREAGIEYNLFFDNTNIYYATNKDAAETKLVKNNINKKTEEIIYNNNSQILEVTFTNNFYVVKELIDLKYQLTIIDKRNFKIRKIKFDHQYYGFGFNVLDYNSDLIKVYYSSINSAGTVYELDLQNKTRVIKSNTQAKIYSAKGYKTKLIWATANDGEKVPILIMYNKYTRKDNKQLLLKVYGAYGVIPDYNFYTDNTMLMNQGFIVAYAFVRGGSFKGKDWHESGKLLNKIQTFTDYISCAEYLINKKYTDNNNLIGYGNSAGGLVMGYVANNRSDLFNTLIFDHPFLDVLNTMSNEKLPLTTMEYKEWGNPNNKKDFDYIKSYSPYQNITKQEYPNMYFISGLNDKQTPYWQILKSVAKYRENNTGNNIIILETDMKSGHMGAINNYAWLKQFAKNFAFMTNE